MGIIPVTLILAKKKAHPLPGLPIYDAELLLRLLPVLKMMPTGPGYLIIFVTLPTDQHDIAGAGVPDRHADGLAP
jgi:hypothetical protein